MKKTLLTLCAALLCTAQLLAYDPPADAATALAQGKTLIAEKKYRDAVKLLQDAIPLASRIEDAKQRSQALGVLRFYTAVALSGMGDDTRAAYEIEQFLALMPEMNHVDPEKYDKRFVKMFDKVVDNMATTSDGSFDRIYPGFSPVAVSDMGAANSVEFDQTIEYALLATRQEKKAWASTGGAAERAKFISDFWARRDPTADDAANPFRDEFHARVAFADKAFASKSERGALTHRGRVFILLGKPGTVKERAMTPRDANMSRSGASNQLYREQGEIETWNYRVDQIPGKVPGEIISFRFTTQENYGDHTLNFEPITQRALTAAAEASVRTK
jgi:GWxTD domain-containing protein